MNGSSLLLLLIAAAAGTFLLRASFLAFVPAERLPGRVRRALRYVPPAVLAALAVPAFQPAHWPPAGAADLIRPVAALVAVAVALRFGNIFLTLGAGMGTLWVLSAVIQASGIL